MEKTNPRNDIGEVTNPMIPINGGLPYTRVAYDPKGRPVVLQSSQPVKEESEDGLEALSSGNENRQPLSGRKGMGASGIFHNPQYFTNRINSRRGVK